VELHFAGPHAHKLEQDFGHLLRTGRLGSPSIPIPGYVPDPQRKTTLGYSECNSAKGRRPATSTYNDLYGSYSSLSSANSILFKNNLVTLSVVMLVMRMLLWTLSSTWYTTTKLLLQLLQPTIVMLWKTWTVCVCVWSREMLTSSAKPIAKKGLESTASCYFFLEENSVVHYSHIMMIKNQPPLQHFLCFFCIYTPIHIPILLLSLMKMF